jgi:predicted ATPase
MGMSQNVVDVTIQSLQTLLEELQRVLSIAAFLRSSFDLGTLHFVVAESNEGEAIGQTPELREQLLEIAVTSSGKRYPCYQIHLSKENQPRDSEFANA